MAPRNIVSAADLDDQGQYLVARVPGLNGRHQGVPWKDGVIGPISGYQVRELLGGVPLQVWEYDPKAEFRWTRFGPRYDLPKVLDAEEAAATEREEKRAQAMAKKAAEAQPAVQPEPPAPKPSKPTPKARSASKK